MQHGDVDMAWVGARAFDTAGVTSFQALLAPMLIDSQDLQGAVFEAGIPEAMLAGLEDIGLAGIGVLPGPMRKILGIDDSFVVPADFRGAVVGIQQSGVAELTMAALGAETQVAHVRRPTRRPRCLRPAVRLDRDQPVLEVGTVRDGERQPVAPAVGDLHER